MNNIARWTGESWENIPVSNLIVPTDEIISIGGDFKNLGIFNDSYQQPRRFIFCNFCDCELREDEINNGKCPNCGGPIRRDL